MQQQRGWFESLVKSAVAFFFTLTRAKIWIRALQRTVFLKASTAPGFEGGHELPSLSSLKGNGPLEGNLLSVCACSAARWLRAQAVPRAPWVPLWILQLKMLQKFFVFLLSFGNCQLEGVDILVHWSRFFLGNQTLFLCLWLLSFCKGFPSFHNYQMQCCENL